MYYSNNLDSEKIRIKELGDSYRYYDNSPYTMTNESCRVYGSDHKYYDCDRAIDPRWNKEQCDAYEQGYING